MVEQIVFYTIGIILITLFIRIIYKIFNSKEPMCGTCPEKKKHKPKLIQIK